MEKLSACPGCGVRLPVADSSGVAPDPRHNASGACWQLNLELTAYTLTLGDRDFLHQLAVDAYAAQHVGENSRPIGVAFALIGLYLTYERGYSGRQVQHMHMLLANRSKSWPRFTAIAHTYRMTALDVVKATPGERRNAALRAWGRAVWEAWRTEHDRVRGLFDRVMAD